MSLRLSRDVIILIIGLGLGVWEVLHDARPVVLTFVGSLLAGPLVMRADESRKNTAAKNADSEATQ